MKEGRKFNKIVSLVLAAVMMVSVFAVTTPQEVEAASTINKEIKGTGTTTVRTAKKDSYAYSNKETLIKFKPKKNGYVTLKFTSSDNAYGNITFCNGKKQTLGVKNEFFYTDALYTYENNRVYAVKKNTTYYFKVKSSGALNIKATVTALSKNAGTSRKNAKVLTKGKTKKGIILPGDKKVDWYKINFPGTHRLNLTCKFKPNGITASLVGDNIYYSAKTGLRVTFCKSNGKKWLSGSSFKVDSIENSIKGQVYGKRDQYGRLYPLEKGTYYVKVERLNKNSSGYYELRFKLASTK